VDARRTVLSRILSRADVGGGLTRVSFAPDPEIAATHTRPGQYVEVVAGAERGFFALANLVGAPVWELLVKSSGGASEALLASVPGDPVDVSAALGAGFPDSALDAPELVVVVGGSAIAVAPPILARRRAHLATTHLYVGVRTPEDTPLRDELRAWQASGVRVTVCASRGGTTSLGGLRIVRGYVQDVLSSDALGDVAIAVAGPDALVVAVRELGGPTDLSVYTNV
jgi:NAD(P)H-flavin reductase